MDDQDPAEDTAAIECEMIDAARELVQDHGYSEDDIHQILAGTVFG